MFNFRLRILSTCVPDNIQDIFLFFFLGIFMYWHKFIEHNFTCSLLGKLEDMSDAPLTEDEKHDGQKVGLRVKGC